MNPKGRLKRKKVPSLKGKASPAYYVRKRYIRPDYRRVEASSRLGGMEIKLEEYDYYIHPGYTDMRKQARTLALLVQSEMELNPFDRSIFVFCGKSRTIIKALCWNGNGWLEIIKRMETGERFHWPTDAQAARKTDLDTIIGTLKGYNMWKPFTSAKPSRVG